MDEPLNPAEVSAGSIPATPDPTGASYRLPGIVYPPHPAEEGVHEQPGPGVSDDPQTAAARVAKHESGGNPYVGVGGADLKNAPIDANGAPVWEGHEGSHAFGTYQFQPGTWARYAPALGIKDWRAPGAQEEVFRAAYKNEGYAPWAPYDKPLAAEIGWKGAPPSSFAEDIAAHGRLNGNTWEDINAHMDTATQAAKDQGASESDIDTYLGYIGTGELARRLADDMAQKPSGSPPSDLSGGVVSNPTQTSYGNYATPASAAGPITPAIAVQYAQAVNAGEVKSPQQFAQVYTDELWKASGLYGLAQEHKAVAAQNIATQLPGADELTDSAIYSLRDYGLPPTMENTREAKANYANLWSRSGLSPATVAQGNDPVTQQRVTTPGGIQKPDEPQPPPPKQSLADGMGTVATGAIKAYAKWWKEGPLVKAISGKADPETVMRDLAMGFGTDAGGGIVGATLMKRTALPPGSLSIAERTARTMAGPLDKALNKVVGRAKATKIDLSRAVDKVDMAYRSDSVQKSVYRDIEERLIDPNHAHKPETQEYLKQVKDLTDMEYKLGKDVAALLDEQGLQHDARIFALTDVNGGYVHRIKLNDQTAPNAFQAALNKAEEQRNAATGAKNTLSPYASSMQDRTAGVWEAEPNPLTPDKPGFRSGFGHASEALPFGTKDPATGATFRPATSEEISAYSGNVLGQGKINFYENHLVNTVVNVDRLSRVYDNLLLIKDQGKLLSDAGLFVKGKPGMAGRFQAAPQGFVRVDIPGMSGWAHPRIATVLNDFYSHAHGVLEDFAAKANHFLMTTLFLLPVFHVGNVGEKFIASHGWNFFNPVGFGRMLSSGYRATQEVLSLGPRYLQSIRESSGQMFPNMLPEVRNFFGTMQAKLASDMKQDGTHIWKDYIKGVATGAMNLSPREMGAAHMQWSHSMTWVLNDILKLTREFEYEKQGLMVGDAIQKAEIDMPAYRMPRAMANGVHDLIVRFYDNPLLTVFGRWNYGDLRGVALTIKQAVAGSPLVSRAEAISKLTFTVALGTFGLAAVNTELQNITGNPNATVAPFGSTKYVHAGVQALQGRWWKSFSSLLPLSPLVGVLEALRSGADQFGRPIIRTAGDWVATVVSIAEALGDKLPAAQQIIHAAQQATGSGGKWIESFVSQFIGAQIGLNLTPPPHHGPAYWANKDARAQRHQIQRDQIQQGAHEAYGTISGWIKSHGQ